MFYIIYQPDIEVLVVAEYLGALACPNETFACVTGDDTSGYRVYGEYSSELRASAEGNGPVYGRWTKDSVMVPLSQVMEVILAKEI